ncbi:hypothetical protein [Auritidibacter ignavus]|uniref:hypothetical protein n=1 Tax=Auritidibacter ignavus TaxID=678932 RepID=UPI0015D6076A|nr:hypothetical protein [Auritidibacter ignavus]
MSYLDELADPIYSAPIEDWRPQPHDFPIRSDFFGEINPADSAPNQPVGDMAGASFRTANASRRIQDPRLAAYRRLRRRVAACNAYRQRQTNHNKARLSP